MPCWRLGVRQLRVAAADGGKAVVPSEADGWFGGQRGKDHRRRMTTDLGCRTGSRKVDLHGRRAQ